MDTSHAPLLAQQDGEVIGSTIGRTLAANLSSNRLFWAALGSLGVSLLFRGSRGAVVRRTVAQVAVPLVVLGVVNRLRAKSS